MSLESLGFNLSFFATFSLSITVVSVVGGVKVLAFLLFSTIPIVVQVSSTLHIKFTSQLGKDHK